LLIKIGKGKIHKSPSSTKLDKWLEMYPLMRILKLAKYRLKAQVEKDKDPKWRRTKPPSGDG